MKEEKQKCMKWMVKTLEELKRADWIVLGSFTKDTLLFVKGNRIITWNIKNKIVEREGELN